jgi:outer membrane protein OmpA-like peptidoglycan-associated protein
MLRSSAHWLLPLAILLAARVSSAQTAPAAPSVAAPGADAAGPSSASDGAQGDELWRQRDLQLFEQDALGGGVGLLHTQHAQSGAPGQLRLGFTSELFSAGFLCTQAYPCPNPHGGAPLTTDSLTHLGGTLTLSATITRWLEAYAATGAYGNTDTANHPALLQVFGDTELGVKVFRPISRVFHVGGVTELDLVNGSGAVGLAGAGTGAKFRLLGTADLRGAEKPTALRVSLNTTYAVDDSAQVLSAYEAAAGAPVNRIERFGLEINRVDHLDINLGVETFLASERVRPFVEYSLLAPINRQGYACPTVNASNDGCLALDTVVPSKLTLGSRFFPWKHGFSLTLGFDVGVTGVHTFIEEVSPTPPWMLYVGAGWAIDTQERPPIETTKVVERVIPPAVLGELRGRVHPKDKSDGIADAVVAFDNHPELTSRVSQPDGGFHVPVDPGTYKLVVHAKGYREGACNGEMPSAPTTVAVDCALEPALVEVTANEITISQQIQFQVDSAVILAESDALMREIADTLIKNPRISKVEVQGHTDSSGPDEYNKTLSEARAAAVRDWLTSHGVEPDRLVAHGYGEERPLIPNVTKGMKAQNRRVQFIILGQTAQGAGDSRK